MAINAEVNVKIDVEALEENEVITLANGGALTLNGMDLPAKRVEEEVFVEDGKGEVRFEINGEIYSSVCSFDGEAVVAAGPIVKGASFLFVDRFGKRVMVGDTVIFSSTGNGLTLGEAVRAGAARLSVKTGFDEEKGKDIVSNPMFENAAKYC